jgi:hypothetical protein
MELQLELELEQLALPLESAWQELASELLRPVGVLAWWAEGPTRRSLHRRPRAARCPQ